MLKINAFLLAILPIVINGLYLPKAINEGNIKSKLVPCYSEIRQQFSTQILMLYKNGFQRIESVWERPLGYVSRLMQLFFHSLISENEKRFIYPGAQCTTNSDCPLFGSICLIMPSTGQGACIAQDGKTMVEEMVWKIVIE